MKAFTISTLVIAAVFTFVSAPVFAEEEFDANVADPVEQVRDGGNGRNSGARGSWETDRFLCEQREGCHLIDTGLLSFGGKKRYEECLANCAHESNARSF